MSKKEEMRHEFAREFSAERFVNYDSGARVLAEFLCELFDELGFPSMNIRTYENPEKNTWVIKARWEE